MTRGLAPVMPGQVLDIPEAHYLYGTGTLRLRVTKVGARFPLHPAMEWLTLHGVEVRWDGKDGPVRQVQVRVAALPEIPRG